MISNIQTESSAGVVLNGSHGQEDTDDGKDNTKGGIANSTKADYPLPYLCSQTSEIQSCSKPGSVRLGEHIERKPNHNESNEHY